MTDHPAGLVCVAHQDWCYTRPLISLTAVTHEIPRGTEWKWAGGNAPTIPAKRNGAVRQLLDDPSLQWLAFLDSDQVFPPDVLQQLLSVDADIATGLVLQKYRGAHYAPCAGMVKTLPEDAPPKRPTDHEDFWWNPIHPGKVAAGEMGVADVDLAGTGCMLIRRRVFEYMEPPWFIANEEKHPGSNADYNFTVRARRDFDFRIRCDTTLQIEHVGPEGVTVETAAEHWRRFLKEKEQGAG